VLGRVIAKDSTLSERAAATICAAIKAQTKHEHETEEENDKKKETKK